MQYSTLCCRSNIPEEAERGLEDAGEEGGG
jgi:hypothetical protein